jgi:hypothetical protein
MRSAFVLPLALALGCGPSSKSFFERQSSAAETGHLLGAQAAAQFAGFTGGTFNGAAGGREMMNSLCNSAFPGSHLCHVAEYDAAGSPSPPPVSGAWIDDSGFPNQSGVAAVENGQASPMSGRITWFNDVTNCGNWTELSYTSMGKVADAKGRAQLPAGQAQVACKTALPIACCSTPAPVFAGYTDAEDGNRGGRAQMHALCNGKFFGSHLCHISEYYLAAPAGPPPPSGAWVDNSGFPSQFGTSVTENSLSSIDAGRITTFYDTGNCGNWSETTYTSMGNLADAQGRVVTPAGPKMTACKDQHPAACCQ